MNHSLDDIFEAIGSAMAELRGARSSRTTIVAMPRLWPKGALCRSPCRITRPTMRKSSRFLMVISDDAGAGSACAASVARRAQSLGAGARARGRRDNRVRVNAGNQLDCGHRARAEGIKGLADLNSACSK